MTWRDRPRGGLLARLGARPSQSRTPPPPSAALMIPDRSVPTRGLGILIDAVRGRPAPILLDLGGAVNDNVRFLTAELRCRLVVADLFRDLDARAADAARAAGDDDGAWIASRLDRAPVIDAVLCWDTIEHLTPAEAQVLAAVLTRSLRPHGVLVASFSGALLAAPGYARYVISDRSTLHRQFRAGASRQRRVLSSRDVLDLFSGLSVVESVLLKTRTREMVFRKAPGAGRVGRR